MRNLIILMVAFMSVSCSKEQDDIVGNWYFQKGTNSALYLNGKSASLSFKSDGTLVCVYDGRSAVKRYSTNGEKLYINDNSMSHPIKISCKKNSLVIYSNITDLNDPANPDGGTVYYTR